MELGVACKDVGIQALTWELFELAGVELVNPGVAGCELEEMANAQAREIDRRRGKQDGYLVVR